MLERPVDGSRPWNSRPSGWLVECGILLGLASFVLAAPGCGSFVDDPDPAASSAAFVPAVEEVVGETVPEDVLFAGIVRSVPSNDVLFARRPTLRMHPASNVKLVTVAAALWKGWNTQPVRRTVWRTSLHAPGTTGGAWTLVGGGDPLLSTSDLEGLAELVALSGRRVTGVLQVDGSALPGPHFGTGWMWDDEPASYMPYLSALSVNGGTVAVDVSLKEGAVLVSISPPGAAFDVIGEIVPAGAGSDSTAKIRRPLGGAGRTIQLGGSLPQGESKSRSFSIPDPDLVAGEVLRHMLIERGLADADLIVRRGTTQAGDVLVAPHTRPVDQVFRAILKDSDNLAAELLLRRIGAESEPRTEDATAAGLRVISEYLLTLGHPKDSYRIVDGSGLSHLNLISPALIVDVLRDRLADQNSRELLTRSMSVAGVDGTLQGRMFGTPAEGRVRAKTGTLSGASALSGFVTHDDGRIFVFSWMINHHVGSSRPWRELQDRLTALVADEALVGVGNGKQTAETDP